MAGGVRLTRRSTLKRLAGERQTAYGSPIQRAAMIELRTANPAQIHITRRKALRNESSITFFSCGTC